MSHARKRKIHLHDTHLFCVLDQLQYTKLPESRYKAWEISKRFKFSGADHESQCLCCESGGELMPHVIPHSPLPSFPVLYRLSTLTQGHTYQFKERKKFSAAFSLMIRFNVHCIYSLSLRPMLTMLCQKAWITSLKEVFDWLRVLRL